MEAASEDEVAGKIRSYLIPNSSHDPEALDTRSFMNAKHN